MGYNTAFEGEFNLNKPLTSAHREFLMKFSETRRVRRDASKTCERPDPVRETVGLPVGPEGAYFVGETGFYGQDKGPDVVDNNRPPQGQPSLWCLWHPNDEGTALFTYGGKFYEYVDWIKYLIQHFLVPFGYVLNGEVEWDGEHRDDYGRIVVENNRVRVE